MADEPTLGEVMRRLDELVRTIASLAGEMREDRAHASATYVRRDVYLAERLADQAAVTDVVRDLDQLQKATQERDAADKAFRRQASLVAAGAALGLVGSIVLSVAGWFLGGGPA
ncbi:MULTISPECIES: hypothetical protein [unclassified Aeromicrobium]|uniref:hypothetical protein n=1 Tax=unclassified Aeromicrobium TaxID=2633570 RepID=UPI002889A0A7|nr:MULTISPECIES: hypothetical protein [unclassified Aeromicrobium]